MYASYLGRKIVTSPTDPDGLNKDRASSAQAAVDRFREVTGTDEDDAIGDLLADLRHLCAAKGLDFDSEVRKSHAVYQEETGFSG